MHRGSGRRQCSFQFRCSFPLKHSPPIVLFGLAFYGRLILCFATHAFHWFHRVHSSIGLKLPSMCLAWISVLIVSKSFHFHAKCRTRWSIVVPSKSDRFRLIAIGYCRVLHGILWFKAHLCHSSLQRTISRARDTYIRTNLSHTMDYVWQKCRSDDNTDKRNSPKTATEWMQAKNNGHTMQEPRSARKHYEGK